MKVVLFCGGLGMRLREHSESVPKSMVNIGYRPILWHIMKYYAHYGHKEFILCLGYKADSIKNYFVHYDESISNDFILTNGGRKLRLLSSDIDDWKITFVDTGLHSNIGERLRQVERYIEDDEVFLANYTDGLTDLHLPDMIDHFNASQKTASFVSSQPTHSFHVVKRDESGLVTAIQHLAHSDILINGGYFIFKRRIFDYVRSGEELVEAPFQKLIAEKELISYHYNGFWAPMDTFKDKQLLDELYGRGEAPWEVWKSEAARARAKAEAGAPTSKRQAPEASRRPVQP
jgi:glucose-1-phosphate cytidylyltransferase